ncbi:hypothetical protein F2Q69_00002980 [Brassica cretica]|uniref:Uncharacterized protein n=1 Tax=Brassica cretica TaxID=69181 RepID=A0A8S9NU23_BRACR|nr:hypothetical protein F2Q69_00002980 [Brassica cretica]
MNRCAMMRSPVREAAVSEFLNAVVGRVGCSHYQSGNMMELQWADGNLSPIVDAGEIAPSMRTVLLGSGRTPDNPDRNTLSSCGRGGEPNGTVAEESIGGEEGELRNVERNVISNGREARD